MFNQTKSNHSIDDQEKYKENRSSLCLLFPARLQVGMICPHCGLEKLDYNSLLQLVCPHCGMLEAGTFT